MYRQPVRINSRLLTLTLLFSAVLGFVALETVARAHQEWEPICITAETSITPGQPVALDLSLTGGPSNYTVYSDPPGTVASQGELDAATGTITADTESYIPASSVTVYLETDGEEIVSADVPINSQNVP